MAYDPIRAFLSGVCDTLTNVPPVDAPRFARIGWPAGPEISDRALTAMYRALARFPTPEMLAHHEQALILARAEDTRRLDQTTRLTLIGQCVGLLGALLLISATGALAIAGHDRLAYTPIGALLAAMVGARVWLERQPEAHTPQTDESTATPSAQSAWPAAPTARWRRPARPVPRSNGEAHAAPAGHPGS